MATPTGGKTPIMPALEALLQQTANVAANVSKRDAKREFLLLLLLLLLSVCEEVESVPRLGDQDGRSRSTQHARHVT